MNHAAYAMRDAGKRGVRIVPHPADPSNLSVRPIERVPEELLARLKQHKTIIIRRLLDPSPCPVHDDASAQVFEECCAEEARAGHRLQPGDAAWLRACGTAMLYELAPENERSGVVMAADGLPCRPLLDLETCREMSVPQCQPAPERGEGRR